MENETKPVASAAAAGPRPFIPKGCFPKNALPVRSPLKRTEHWATRELHKFFLQEARKPFAWGTNDCCMFPANAILAFTGIDLAADLRGKYSDLPSAVAAIQSVSGGKTVADAVAWCAAKHNLPELKFPKQAQRGDLVVMKQPATGADGAFGSELAGIVHLNGRDLITVGESGLVRISILNVLRAWRV